ncbi:MAG TPA: response regulator [Ktedonobacteraceae bacterium]|nr:response regulator [Ktedonobacteraceae bacterium]
MGKTMHEEKSINSPAVAKTILIVDDDGDIATVLADAISTETPYQPLVAASAAQASRLVQRVKPDLLILDYHLPGLNGIELYDWLHTDPLFENTPALLLTASQQMPYREIISRHIVGLGKPIELDQFLATIHQLLDEE